MTIFFLEFYKVNLISFNFPGGSYRFTYGEFIRAYQIGLVIYMTRLFWNATYCRNY